MNKRVKLEVNIDNVRHNYLLNREITKQGELCIPMIKADAYGFNQIHVVNSLLTMDKPQKDFFVYSIGEGVELRMAFGDKINKIYCVVGCVSDGEEELAVKYNLIPTINNLQQLRRFSNEAKKVGKTLEITMQINLGLNRSGLMQHELDEAKKIIEDKNNKLNLTMVFGHLACQYELDTELGKKYTKKEYDLFIDSAKKFPYAIRGLLGGIGILKIPEGHLETSRPGTTLYAAQPQGETRYIFKDLLTITAPVHILKGTKDTIYIDFGIRNGLCHAYEQNGFVYIDDEKVKVNKLEYDKTLFKVKDNSKYEGKTALLVGYHGNKHIGGFQFSDMNGTVPEEELYRVVINEDIHADEVDCSTNGGCEIKRPNINKIINFKNTVKLTKDKHIKTLFSTITEIRTIERDGACGYDAGEDVKTGDIIATMPFGYADGFARAISQTKVLLYVKHGNEFLPCPLCGRIPMDQACFRIPFEYKDKIKVGDEVYLIDEENDITADRFEQATNSIQDDLFYLVPYGKRTKIIIE